MSETNNRRDSAAAKDLAAPWLILLNSAEQRATAVADEVMDDAVLAECVTTSVSAYLAQRGKLTVLRKEFAEADTFCCNLRKEATELMHSLGFDFEWDQEDISAVDEQLVVNMKEAAEKAAAINKKRVAANVLENQLLNRVLDEIALCASIAVLRQVNRFTCEGDAFCVAYITTSVLRERTIDDQPMTTCRETLSEWLQYSIGVIPRAVEFDIYAKSPVAAGIGKGMGIENTGALRLALIDAMKKLHAEKSR